jgi:hypothetical protein
VGLWVNPWDKSSGVRRPQKSKRGAAATLQAYATLMPNSRAIISPHALAEQLHPATHLT